MLCVPWHHLARCTVMKTKICLKCCIFLQCFTRHLFKNIIYFLIRASEVFGFLKNIKTAYTVWKCWNISKERIQEIMCAREKVPECTAADIRPAPALLTTKHTFMSNQSKTRFSSLSNGSCRGHVDINTRFHWTDDTAFDLASDHPECA